MKKGILYLIALVSIFGVKIAGASAVLPFTGVTMPAMAYTWTGAGADNSWSDNNNWSPSTGHPMAGDTAIIPFTVNPPNVDVASACAFLNITGSTVLNLSAPLAVSGQAAMNASVTISGSSGNLTMSSLLINNNNSLTTLAGTTLIADKATVLVLAYIQNEGALTVNHSFALSFEGQVINSGTINARQSLLLMGLAYIQNNAGATINQSGSFIMSEAAQIYNLGALRADTAALEMDNSVYFNNAVSGTFTTNGVSSISMFYGAVLSNSGMFNFGNTAIQIGNSGYVYNAAGAVFTLNAGSTVDFAIDTAANSYIANAGTFYAGTFNSPCTLNLNYPGARIQNTGTFYLGSSSVINLTAYKAYLANTGTFTLQSDSTGSAAIGNISGQFGSCFGNYAVERYISGGSSVYRSYRLLSSPVYTAQAAGNNVYSVNYVKLSSLVTGTGGTAGGFDQAGNPSLYLYRDNLAPSNSSFTSGNFRGISNIVNAPSYNLDGETGTYNIPVGNGFLFFFRGDRTTNLANKYTPGTSAESVTFTATGMLNTGPVTVIQWFTPTLPYLDYTAVPGNSAIIGFSLTGNPYPSSIDWDTYSTSLSSAGIYAPDVSPFTYILDPVSKNYSVYEAGTGGVGTIANSGANIISSGQGFFVVADDAAAQLTFNESAKTNAQVSKANGNLFLGAPPQASVSQYLHLKLSRDSVNTDGIFINFKSSAKFGYVMTEDAAYKTGNGSVSFSSLSADKMALAINSMPLPGLTQTVIPLAVNVNEDGVYQINLTAMKSIPDLYEIWLMDAHTHDSLDIKHNPGYSFNVVKSDSGTYGAKRFSLVIRQNPALGLHLLSFTAAKATNGAKITWETENEADYTNFTIERSTDNGATFTVLGGFASSGLGTYTYLDAHPLNANQYRLKLQDLNGSISYSGVVTLMYADPDKVNNNISVYPNPTNGIINLAVNQSTLSAAGLPGLGQSAGLVKGNITQLYDIRITSITGSLITSATSQVSGWQGNVSRLTPGTYIIQVLNSSDKSVVGKSTFVKL